MSNSRRIGHDAERRVVNDLKSIGYKKAATTRFVNRYMDALKIDIANVPFYIQVKAGKQHVTPIPLLKQIEANVLNEEWEMHPILIVRIYKINPGKRRKFNDDLVFILTKNFKKFFGEPGKYFEKVMYSKGKYNTNYRKLLTSIDDCIIRETEDELLVFSYRKFLNMIR